MTDVAGVRDFQRLADGGADEAKGVAADIIIPLHPVLMGRTVGKMGERGFPRFVVLQPPEVTKLQRRLIPSPATVFP